MKIKIHKENEHGWAVYRKVGNEWKWWLPKIQHDLRSDEYCSLYKNAAEAEKQQEKTKT